MTDGDLREALAAETARAQRAEAKVVDLQRQLAEARRALEDDLSEIDTTPEEFDRMWGEGEPVRLVEPPSYRFEDCSFTSPEPGDDGRLGWVRG